MSAVILTYRPFGNFDYSTVFIQSLSTGTTYPLEMHAGPNLVNMRPATLAVVPPGRYRLVHGAVYSGGSSAGMPLLEYWFEEFDVGAGETIDLGALVLEAIDVRSLAHARGLDALLRFGNDNDTTTYVAYRIEPADTYVHDLMSTQYPTFTPNVIARPLRTTVTREEFESLILESFAPDQNGTPPSTEAARARVGERIAALFRQRK